MPLLVMFLKLPSLLALTHLPLTEVPSFVQPPVSLLQAMQAALELQLVPELR